jgi:hypothetical protein
MSAAVEFWMSYGGLESIMLICMWWISPPGHLSPILGLSTL